MSAKPCFVSVVAAVADAEPIIEAFTRECIDVLRAHYRDFELILVDDASTDDTVARVDGLLQAVPAVRLIRLARRFGADVALTAGLDSSIGDYIVLMQPECDPPGEIPRLIEQAQLGYGVVTGVAAVRPGEGLGRRLLRRGFADYCNRFLGIHYPRDATRFQVLSRQAASAVTRVRNKCPQLPVLASRVGYGGTTHPYTQVARPAVPGSFRLLDKLDRGLSIMLLNSRSPLRLVSYLGISAGLLNLLYASYVMMVNLFSDHVAAGWTTLSLHVTSMFFLVFLILVVICEYVGRILEEAQDRPLYHVQEERNSSGLELHAQRNIADKAA